MAKKFDSLNKLREKIATSSHGYRSSTETFASIDVEKVAKDLDLVEAAQENGRNNRPPSSAKSIDAFERTVVELIRDEQKSAHQIVEDNLQLFSERMAGLDFDEKFGLIRQANEASVTDFKGEVSVGLDELHDKRRILHTAEVEYEDFRKRNRLVRAARVSSGFTLYMKFAIIVLLLIIETILNGSFLAGGSDEGLVGGFTLALTFSVMNIGGALLFSMFLATHLVHRNWLLKLVGLLGASAYAAYAVGINLGLAHYRDISLRPGFEGDIGRATMQSLTSTPFQLDSVNSWLLFGLGFMFSIIAFIDGTYIRDPYQGYGGVRKRLDRDRQDYISRKDDLIDTLCGIRDDHNAKVEEVVGNLSKSQREYRAIVEHRARILSLFATHQDQLERAGNTLLKRYRAENTKARETATPKYFESQWKMDRIQPRRPADAEWGEKELSEGIRSAQDELRAQMKLISKECESGIEQYRALDNIHPDKLHG